jgi:hypothetical protein
MNTHSPVPVTVEYGETIGGKHITLGTEVQLRCSCRPDLGWDYPHD